MVLLDINLGAEPFLPEKNFYYLTKLPNLFEKITQEISNYGEGDGIPQLVRLRP